MSNKENLLAEAENVPEIVHIAEENDGGRPPVQLMGSIQLMLVMCRCPKVSEQIDVLSRVPYQT